MILSAVFSVIDLQRFKMRKIICALLGVVVLLSLSLSSCSGGVKLTDKNGGCVDAKSGTRYNYASICYEPISLGDEYGELSVGKLFTYKLYTVKDMEKSQWLATEENNILYAEGVSLPTLAEMKAHTIGVFTMESSGLEVFRVGDKKLVESVVKAYEEGEKLTYPMIAAAEKYKVKFYGDTLKGVCYSLTYLEYADDIFEDGVNYGRYFLYDAFDRIFVPIGNEIHDALEGVTTSADSSESNVGGVV
jgi:hypothetical protein